MDNAAVGKVLVIGSWNDHLLLKRNCHFQSDVFIMRNWEIYTWAAWGSADARSVGICVRWPHAARTMPLRLKLSIIESRVWIHLCTVEMFPVTLDRQWVLFRGKRLLSLPADFRPNCWVLSYIKILLKVAGF